MLLSTSHEAGKDVERHVLVFDVAHVNIDQVWPLVLKVFLHDVLPELFVAIVVEFDFFLVFFEVFGLQGFDGAHRPGYDVRLLAQLENIRLVLIDPFAIFTNFIHLTRFPISKLSIYDGASLLSGARLATFSIN